MKTVKKKGGIIIKKLTFFLMLLSLFFIPSVYAKAATFYEAEYIDGIYMTKYNFNTRETRYQKARFFRKADTDEFAYCVEPFAFFQENQSYVETNHPYNLSEDKINRITKIAYYGYGYGNHTDPKWYAITQMMIWQASDDAGNYYFTETLNGPRVNMFNSEMTEINNLVNESNKVPSFANQEFEMVEGNELSLEDHNNVLSNFSSNNQNLEIQNNNLLIHDLSEGEYEFSFIKNIGKRQAPTLYYESYNSQNMVRTGSIPEQEISLKVKVVKTSLELTKLDQDTESTTPSGNASLNGAIYELLDQNEKVLEDLEIIDNKATIENLDFGKYYIKEKTPGEGYQLDPEVYEIEITSDNPNVSLELKNTVIKAEVTIEKTFGEEDNWEKENNISFWVQDKYEQVVETVTTNTDGIAKATLPYGTYTIVQINTTDGYKKANPLTFQIMNNEPITIKLKDIKIEVPDTHTEKENFSFNFLYLLLWFIL